MNIFSHASNQSKAPDFAFPKTVDKEAKADLNKALKTNDAHAALNALIRIYVANTIIDPASFQESIKLIEETQKKFSDSDISGLFSALLAKIYACEYLQDTYKYNYRETPLSPVPEDITEWNATQFKQKIAALCEDSWAKASQLAAIDIKLYDDIITLGGLTATYFPTLFDFICYNAYSTLEDIDEENFQYVEKALAMAKERDDIPAQIEWELIKCSENEDENLLQAYGKFKDSEYSAPLLLGYLNHKYFNYDEIDQVKECLNLTDAYLQAFPNSPFIGNVLTMRDNILSPSIITSSSNLFTPYKPLKVKIKTININNFEIRVYNADNLENSRSSYDKQLKKRKPVWTKKFNYADSAPFKIEEEIEVAITTTGEYIIVPVVNGEFYNRYFDNVRCIKVFPVALNNNEDGTIVVTNPLTGEPVENATINFYKDKKSVGKSTTDKDGIASMPKMPDNTIEYTITYEGKTYSDDSFHIYTRNYPRAENKRYTANLLTDRSLYHPGENVKALVIASYTEKGDELLGHAHIASNQKVIVKVMNPNYQNFTEIELITDEFGRATFDFDLPTEGLTGNFNITAMLDRANIGSTSITVSDFKLPDFLLTIDSTNRDTPEKGSVTIKGTAKYYSGMPVADANIVVSLFKSSPYRYGLYFDHTEICDTTITANSNGVFSVTFSAETLQDDEESTRQRWFNAVFHAVSPTGTTAEASTIFMQGREFIVKASLPSTIDGEKPLFVDASITNADGKEAPMIPLVWKFLTTDKTVALSGRIDKAENIDISSLTPGTYTFRLEAVDSTLVDPYSVDGIVVFNRATEIVPTDKILWIYPSAITLSSDRTCDIIIGTNNDEAVVYYVLNDGHLRSIQHTKAEKGYNTLHITFPEHFSNGEIMIFSVNECDLFNGSIKVTTPKREELKIVAESFLDNLIPGQTETWKFRVVDADGNPSYCAAAIDMYNQAINDIKPHTFNAYIPIWNNFRYINLYYLSRWGISNTLNLPMKRYDGAMVENPLFNFYGYSFDRPMVMRSKKLGSVSQNRAMYASTADGCEEDLCLAAPAAMEAEEAIMEDTATTGAVDAGEPDFQFRESYVPLAVWAPMLTSDEDGNICYTFTVPNANTTWAFNAIAWDKDTQMASMARKVIASKPIMVVPNLPRFLRVGDTAVISVAVLNNSDSATVATVNVELFDPVTNKVFDTQEYVIDVEAMGSAKIEASVETTATQSAIGFRVKATNGTFADGEQSVIPVLSSNANLVETTPFYLNPGETEYTTTLPSQPDAKITLSLCENPIWTIVSALPGLRDGDISYANAAAASIFSAAIAKGIIKDNPEIAKAIKLWKENPSDSALVSMLEKNEELKIALLNATPWELAAQSQNERMANLSLILDEKNCDRAISKAIKSLKKLQRADGGWAWGEWCDRSSIWVTENVLDMLAELKSLGWMVKNSDLDDMIAKAIKFLDSQFDKKDQDILYCILRPRFKEIPTSTKGQKVITNTINNILKNWKNYSDPAYKAMAAEALYLNKYPTKSRELMASISEFGVWTKNQGLKFPSVNALYDYAIILEAYALIEPQSKDIDGLRQQLIVRKQGNDWGSSVVTNEVVSSILSSGTKWTTEESINSHASVKVDDKTIAPSTPIEIATGSFKTDLSEYAGKSLSITTAGNGPAYGAIFSQFSQTMSDVKSSACDDLSIEKTMTRKVGSEWEYIDGLLNVGDQVKVQLTIKCKRNLQFVSIVDDRPACFEPANQLPGWLYSEGASFYRENLDAATTMHIEYLRPGTYILTYEMNVNSAGTYSSGVATIQSQYAPEISAHSSGQMIEVK